MVGKADQHGDDGGHHHREVEDNGDGRALHELADGVEHARQQRYHRHAQQVRHGDARQQHGEIELFRGRLKARCEPQHQERHGDLGDDGERQDHEHEARHCLLGEVARRCLALALVPLGDTAVFGVLAMASEDPKRFYPEMGTLYLRRIGELCAAGVTARL